MEQILVKRSDNVDYLLEDRNKGVFVSSIIQSTELRSNDVINVELTSREFINFTIGDYFHYLGQKYTLNQIPRYFKNSSNDFQFSMTFEGAMFDLRRASYDVNIDTTGSAIYGETLTADLELFATILIENINRVFPGKWILGEIPAETETKTITFSEEENCLAALQMLCDEYGTDFIIKTNNNGVNILNFKQVGNEIPLEFKVGFQKGLYTLTREKVDASDIVTRLKVYGSDKNLGTDYRANRLVLKDKNKPNSYIENTQAVAKYGVYESTKIFDDIYPRRKGKVTSINSDSIYKFSDISMDFDLKEKDENGTKYLLNGVNAKIHFNTGDLAGYELEIHDYNHETKEFHIIKFADENGYEFPSKDSDAFRIGVGDEYVILDIQMPQIYIDNAEAELFEKADEYLSDKLEPNIQYLLDVDTLHLQRILNDTVTQFFSIGDFIKVVDEDFDINRYIRIKSIERDLRNPFDYKLTLSDSKVTNFLSGTIPGEINTIKNIIKINNLNNPAKARRNWKDAQEVLNMVFDVEGDYYTEKIKPNSIETTHLQVGAKSMQFNLVDSFFEPNFEGNPNKIKWSSCKLVHFTISDKIVDWQIQGGLKDLEANKPYYLYAKCNKSNNIGVIEITENQYTVDQGNYYYFLIGIVNTYSEDVKAREISLMYGFATVSGRFIKAGRIESSGGGNTYFDLDTGEIRGKITFTSDSPAFNQVKDSILISNRNLLLNSGIENDYTNGTQAYHLLSYITKDGKLLKGEEYTILIDITTFENFTAQLWFINNNNVGNSGLNYIENFNTENESKRKIRSFPFRAIEEDSLNFGINVYNYGYQSGENEKMNNRFILHKIALYKGNNAIDWTPAPEDVESSIEQAKQNSINASKAYSDAQDELKRIQAEAYADGKVTAAEQRAIDDATAKAEAAKTYAQAQDNLLRIQMEAYVDGEITAEEQARIQAAQNALNDAKAYSDAQDNLAKITAAAYADGIVDAEEARAIADAEAKMNAAKAHADAAVNNIQIGGRNMLMESKQPNFGLYDQTIGSVLKIYKSEYPTLESDVTYIRVTGGTSNFADLRVLLSLGVPNTGELVSVSFKVKNFMNPITLHSNQGSRETIINVNNQTTLVKWEGIVGNGNGVVQIQIRSSSTDLELYVWDVMYEKGNKATDWTPAPEDVDSAINDVKIKAENALTQLTSIANDNILSPSEKQQVSNELNRIKSEYTSNYSSALSNDIATTNYTNAYNDLYNYIIPLLVSLSIDSPIVGDVFRTKFKAYYDQNIALLVAISNKFKSGIDKNTTDITNANNAIERVNNITSFLGTTVDDNVVATGLLMVGSDSQSNAGISGLNEAGSKSVRLWAGGTAQNRDKASWNTLDDGTMQFFHPNGNIAFRFGLSNGKFIMDGYHEQGMKLWELSPNRGLVNVAYIPESWTNTPMININQSSTTLNVTNAKTAVVNLMSIVVVSNFRRYIASSNYTSFEYQNGTHPDNSQYANLIGYKTVNNSRTSNIPNGWYGLQVGEIDMDQEPSNGEIPPIKTIVYFLYYIENGKVTKNQSIQFTDRDIANK